MNRPRNRQPRPDRNNTRRPPRNSAQGPSSNVPNFQQVVSGAPVSIVLKADQPTGREVQGIVKDLLSRGDHPRGIKVRLQDGRIGRVQRMANVDLTPPQNQGSIQAAPRLQTTGVGQEEMDEQSYSQEPAPGTLADFLPGFESEEAPTNSPQGDRVDFASANIKCPICDKFEGDESAVSHHMEEHFT